MFELKTVKDSTTVPTKKNFESELGAHMYENLITLQSPHYTTSTTIHDSYIYLTIIQVVSVIIIKSVGICQVVCS